MTSAELDDPAHHGQKEGECQACIFMSDGELSEKSKVPSLLGALAIWYIPMPMQSNFLSGVRKLVTCGSPVEVQIFCGAIGCGGGGGLGGGDGGDGGGGDGGGEGMQRMPQSPQSWPKLHAS